MDRIAKLVSGRLKAQPAPGPHPDPELLNAFAENVLPEADRGRLLQHLGACSDCREILYLALPDSPETQKVMVLQPRPFRRWALGWGTLVASVALVAVVLTTNRLGPKDQAAQRIASVPAARTETKIAAEKVPQELDQLQAAGDQSRDKLAASLKKLPQPEAKHMTAKMRPGLVFGESGEVRLQAQEKPSNTVGGLVINGRQKDEKPNGNTGSAAFHGAAIGTGGSAGKLEAYTNAPSSPSPAPAKDKNGFGAAGYTTGLPAQESNAKGNLAGTIVDSSGAVVANAKVTMVGSAGANAASSDSDGEFSFDHLTPGSYSVKAEAPGFKATEIGQVAVLDDRASTLRVTLEPGSVSETVEVAAASQPATTLRADAASIANTTVEVTAAASTAEVNSLSKSAKTRKLQRELAVAVPKWSLTSAGEIQRSLDHGKTWLLAQPVPGIIFRAISSIGPEVWAAGNGGALYHSADSGLTWTRETVKANGKDLQDNLTGIEFTDAARGHLKTAAGADFTTSDGGRNWLPQVAH